MKIVLIGCGGNVYDIVESLEKLDNNNTRIYFILNSTHNFQ